MKYPVWHDDNGVKVTCVEKIKVMEENLTELTQISADLIADAVLMGVSEKQIRSYLSNLMQNLEYNF